MSQLGNGLSAAGHDEDAMAVRETELSNMRRLGKSGENLLAVQSNLAVTYSQLGRSDEALSNFREVYAGDRSLFGNGDGRTLMAANNLVHELQRQNKYAEAVSILREALSEARRALGDDHQMTLMLSSLLSDSLLRAGPSPTVDDVRESIAIGEDNCKRSRRLLGESHPDTRRRQRALDYARSYLALLGLSEG